MDTAFEVSTVFPKGQVIPASVRRAIGVHTEDKILFVRRDDGTDSLLACARHTEMWAERKAGAST